MFDCCTLVLALYRTKYTYIVSIAAFEIIILIPESVVAILECAELAERWFILKVVR